MVASLIFKLTYGIDLRAVVGLHRSRSAAAFEDCRYTQQQYRGIIRLCYVIVRAVAERDHLIKPAAAARQHYHRRTALFAVFLQELFSVNIRKVDVEQHKIGVCAYNLVQRVSEVFYRNRRISGIFKKLCKLRAEYSVIFNYHYFVHNITLANIIPQFATGINKKMNNLQFLAAAILLKSD